MVIEILKEIILDFQNQELETGTIRDLNYSFVQKKAFICIGVRRCGKSTFLYQIIENLKKDKKVKPENIIYINFFDDRLTDLKKEGNLQLILDAYFSIYPEKKNSEKIYCFFDEIQEAKDWEPFIDRLIRTENCEVFLSGSSAKMLSKEIASQMRGRSISWELFPFSFSEYLSYHKIDYKKLTSKNKLLVIKYFNEYFLKGGFPETVNQNDKLRVMIHQEYYKTILHRDIIERFDAIHPQALIQAAFRLITNISNLYSLNRITDYLKTLGFKISKDFVSSAIDWFEDVYFLFSVKLYSSSIVKQNINLKKIYCVDHGLVSSIDPGIKEKQGYILENIVFSYLRTKTDNIFYYRTKGGKEIDFIITLERRKYLIQVCYNFKNEKTISREIGALWEALSEIGITKGIIVTNDDEKALEESGKK
jgi:uncharacterized protein